MTKRQKRYDTPALNNNIPNLLGKNVNIVFKDGTVSFVRLNALEGDSILVANMRLKKRKIALQDISEIILDFEG